MHKVARDLIYEKSASRIKVVYNLIKFPTSKSKFLQSRFYKENSPASISILNSIFKGLQSFKTSEYFTNSIFNNLYFTKIHMTE